MGLFRKNSHVYKIAEIGGNHEGDFDYAKRLTKLAISSSVDAIKFQIYTGDTLVNKKIDPSRHAHFGKFELRSSEYHYLADMCVEAGIDFMASVWNENVLGEFGERMSVLKVGSGDMTCTSVLRSIIRMQKPTIISTGLADINEVDRLVEYLLKVDNEFISKGLLCLLQCTSMYPIPHQEANLRVMQTYKERYGCSVGFSDHTVGIDALKVAIGLDVDAVEFHFTDKREGRSFRDHKVSLTVEDVQALIAHERSVNILLGSRDKLPTQSEIESGHLESFRRSVYARRLIRTGEVICASDLISLRPKVDDSGLVYDDLIGRVARSDIQVLETVLDKLED